MSNDGGPAFPQTEYYDEEPIGVTPGMSLRDYLAAKAMQGILAYPGDEASGSAHNNSTPAEVASMAYEYADWMLAERGIKR